MEWHPRTIIVGAEGFIGRHLFDRYKRIDPETLGTSRRKGTAHEFAFLDLQSPAIDDLPLKGHQQAILAAAITGIETCERDAARTRQVNVIGTLELIRQFQEEGILPVFLSSDYVFEGTREEGYGDDAVVGPTTEYGRQKAAVEQILGQSDWPYLVLRLGKVFGLTRGDGTLLDEMAGRLMAGREVAAARDQVFCPLWIDDLVRAVEQVQHCALRGVVNLCPAQAWARYDLARAVARVLGAPERLVRAISLDDLPGTARRPKCTRLAPARLEREVGFHFTPMEQCLERLTQEYRHE